MLPVPVLPATGPLHIESEQDDLLRAERRREVDRLISGVATAVDAIGFGVESGVTAVPDPVRPEFFLRLFADAPALACEFTEDLRAVDVPESEVSGVEDVGPERELEGRVDDYESRFALDEVEVFFFERRPARRDDDGRSWPSV